MPRDAAFGVFEIGMNHPGEIAPLVALVRPDVAVITCVDRAHLGLMGSEEAIAREKAAVFGGLMPGGTAVIPGDSAFLPLLRAAVPVDARALVFGEGAVDVRLLELNNSAEASEITGEISGVEARFSLAAPGRHMAMNALSVLAAAAALGLDVWVCAVLRARGATATRGGRWRGAVAGRELQCVGRLDARRAGGAGVAAWAACGRVGGYAGVG
jgi:UDP-N-acetylmuramoyl-tripeptide--D-alanyl-D-alanine ligase